MNYSIIPVLSHLEMFKTSTEKSISKYILNQSNVHKKNAMKDNFYVISSPREVEEIIETAIHENMVAVIDFTNEGRLLELTPEGKLALASYWTQNFSPSFKCFSAEFESMMKENNQLLLPQLQMMQMYHNGKDISQLKEKYTTLTATQEMRLAFHQHMICEISGQKTLDPDDIIFHFTPTLFAPIDLKGRKVTLEISGLAGIPTLAVNSPYTNKRYAVAGLRIGKKNSAHGFYPIIAKKQTFPVHKDITLHWIIDNEIKIDHLLAINFNFQNPHGQLFSTIQRFTRPVAGIPNFDIVSTLEKNRNYDSHARVISHDILKHFEIQQNVTLTNFPLELHSYRTSDYFSKWQSNRFSHLNIN